MQPHAARYHCPCEPATSEHAYHTLPSLYFCDECDSVRCPDCVLEEVASYYCPNCLFEVPQASVRAEKNRCARNCFACPCCSNTLSVLASDPSLTKGEAPSSISASIGEPPYYLSCSACRWDSKGVGIVFEKPTGLAGQLAKMEEGLSPAPSEYERIREHLEPYVKAGQVSEAKAAGGQGRAGSSGRAHPTNAIAAAARALSSSSSTVMRDIPSSIASASRFNSLHNLATMHRSGSSRSGLSAQAGVAGVSSSKDDLLPYVSKLDRGKDRKTRSEVVQHEERRVMVTKKAKRLQNLPQMEQKWTATHGQTILAKDLRPQRLPLQSKRTKRCHVCRHIVVKPDPKAASTKYKICLVATTYLPQISVHRRVPPSLTSRISAAGSAATAARRGGRPSVANSAGNAVEILVPIGSTQDISEPLRPGRNYSFQLTFVNPLYEVIEVFVELAEPVAEEEHSEDLLSAEEEKGQAKKKRHWQASMPATSFSMDAFAEAWEYEADDDDEDLPASKKAAKLGPGILAQKFNRTVVQMDLVTGREAIGPVRVPLFVTYTYTAEDAGPLEGKNDTKGAFPAADPDASTTGALKSFSFWASISLGIVVPRAVAPIPAGGSAIIASQERRVASASGSGQPAGLAVGDEQASTVPSTTASAGP